MKKTLLFAAAVLALAACSKESPVKVEGTIDVSKLVFNIDVQNGNATKGVKTAWENGDDVYVFFEDNTTQYVKMTYDGTSWSYADKDGGTTFAGLTLEASGKKVSAVYFPDFVLGSNTFFYDGSSWTLDVVWSGYFQKANGVEYTVTTTSNVTTLNTTLTLTAPARISQIFIPDSEVPAPASGNEYVLTATHLIQTGFAYAYAGGDVIQSNGGIGHPLTGYYGTLGGQTGYYFWGILDGGAGTYDFDFQLVERNAEKEYAMSSKSKSITGKTVPASFAAKLTGLTDNGNFVSLGFGDCLWATGNLDKTNSKIVDPLEAGEYFMYGKTTPYNSSDAIYTGEETPLSTDHDAAYQANNAWCIPTHEQLDPLISSSYTLSEWVSNWTSIGSTKGGWLITSKKNGISVFFVAAGLYNGSLLGAGDEGYYWSSNSFSEVGADYLYFDYSGIKTDLGISREFGFPIRPVKN